MFTLALIGLALTCLAAVETKSLSKFSRHRLKELCEKRNTPERLGVILKHYEQIALAAETLQVLATALVLISGSYWLWSSSLQESETPLSNAVFAEYLVLGIALGAVALLFCEIWIPWALARLFSTRLVYHTWHFWKIISTLLAPFVLAAHFFDTVMHRLAGRAQEEPDEESFEDEIRTIVTEGHREGLLEEDAREMIEGVIELGDVFVSQIMTPRTDMISMPKSLDWEEMLTFVLSAPHSRIPVYDDNRDDIVGVLFAKDLLPELAKGIDEPRVPWPSILRPPQFVPETKPIDVLLQEFQQNHTHMVIVLDEYGGVSGLVTMEDILEEIVGEIVDEYDPVLEEDILEIDEQTIEALGKAHLDELNERFDLDFPEERDYDTIAGYVFSELGHVPVVGEKLVSDNMQISVVEATPRRIERVQIKILTET